jgi:DNA-binding response OmpR family regulator
MAAEQTTSAMDAAMRVLVVEDDDSMRQAIERILNASGIATAGYASAEELLAVGPVEGDKCIVSDLKLPKMSGFELLAELRARGEAQPLILITAHDSRKIRKQAEQNGVAAYLAKPFHGHALVAAVRAVIGPTKPS